jgi:hypothetical protein
MHLREYRNIMTDRVRTLCRLAYAKLGIVPIALLGVFAFYALYEVKRRLGINIFPHWGLHLPGPRAILADVVHGFRRL